MEVIALNTTIFNKADVYPLFEIYPLFLVLALLM